LAPLSQTRQSLIHRGAITEVKQALSRHGRTFRQPFGMRENLFG
jgi:hypothetical protein